MGRTGSFSLISQTRDAVLVLLLAASPGLAQEAGLISSYFDGLRERQLFSVAERYGLDRRAELPIESADSVQLAVELSRTYARHASSVSDPAEQAFLQSRADEVLSDYYQADTAPRIELVTLERAYRFIDRAEMARWSWTADPEDLAARRTAAEQLEKGRAVLSSAIEAATESAAQPAPSRRPDDLTRRELASLIHGARLKTIDLLLLSAELAEKPTERQQLIRLAEDGIKRLGSSPERGTTQALRGFQLRIARLTGDENQFKLLARQTAAERSSVTARQEAVAEQARYELDQGRFEAAAKLLTESKSSLGEISDRLRALHVEAVLGMARSAGGQRQQFLAAAESELANVSGPWRLRSGYLLQQARQIDTYGSAAAELVRRGNRLFRAGNREEAIATFREAAREATVPAGRAELRFMAASLLVEAERFADAIVECQSVASDAPTQTLAARASLLIAYCRGRLYAQTRSSEDRVAYNRSLEEHLRQFPKDPTAGDAAWMLIGLAEQSGRPAAVVDADRLMPADHPKAAESLDRAVNAVLRALEEIRTTGVQDVDGRPAAEWAGDSTRLAGRLLAAGGKDIRAARRTLMAARLLAAVPQPRFESVAELLNRIPQPSGSQVEDPDWQELSREAAALRLVGLTATGQFAGASKVLEQLGTVSIGELLDVLRKMNAAGRQLEGERRSELARLELKTIQRIRLHSEKLSADERQLLIECEAEALFASGQFAEAARMFEEALAVNPGLAPRLAEALEGTGGRVELGRALRIWRQEEAKHPQGSGPWFEVQLHIGRALLALGQAAECRKLLVQLRLLYPEMGGALKPAFEELERQAGTKPGP